MKDKGCKFSLSLRLGSSFNFSLSSEGCSPEATQRTRRSPSYLRRQTLRRAAFLERKKKLPLAEETASTGNDNNVCRQGGSDLLDKKVASSGQTAQKEDKTVDQPTQGCQPSQLNQMTQVSTAVSLTIVHSSTNAYVAEDMQSREASAKTVNKSSWIKVSDSIQPHVKADAAV